MLKALALRDVDARARRTARVDDERRPLVRPIVEILVVFLHIGLVDDREVLQLRPLAGGEHFRIGRHVPCQLQKVPQHLLGVILPAFHPLQFPQESLGIPFSGNRPPLDGTHDILHPDRCVVIDIFECHIRPSFSVLVFSRVEL